MLNFLNSGLTKGHWRRATVLAAAILFSPQVWAFTFTVNSLNDAVDDNPGDGSCHTAAGECTLRAAIQEANAWSGADVIRLPAGTYKLTIANDPSNANENAAATGDLDILSDITINGENAATTIVDGNNTDRVFDVVSTLAHFTLTNVTVQNGLLNGADVTGAGINSSGFTTIENAVVTQNKFSQQNGGGGGGIAMVQGSLTIDHSDIVNNSASGFAGIQQNLGVMTITNSSITGNSAVGSGAGIGIFNGTATITNTTISDNLGANIGGQGGGINNGGHTLLVGSTLSGNQDSEGGGIVNIGTGTITVLNSTLQGNIALNGTGGGILNLSGGQSVGGADTAIIINSTIVGNKAKGQEDNSQVHAGYGGGLFYSGSRVLLNHTIVAQNTADTADPDCSTGPAQFYTPGTIDSRGHNLDTSNTCQLNATGDLPGSADPFVTGDPLASNGGPTQTVMLGAGVPAINGGATSCTDQNAAALTTDQRGFPRPSGPACDIGAVEVQANDASLSDLSVHITQSTDPVTPGTQLTYTLNVTDNGPANATGVTLTDTLPNQTNYVSGSSGCSNSGQTVTCAIGSVAVGTPAVITITVGVASTATSTLTNTATVAGGSDPNSGNNTDSIDTAIDLQADIQVNVSHTPEPAVLNQDNVTYTVTVTSATNGTYDTLPAVTLTNTLPDNATLVDNSTTTTRGSCAADAASKLVTCQLGSMAPGDGATIKFTVTPTLKGTMTDTAIANFNGTDATPTDNKFVDTAHVEVRADVAVTVTPVPASPGTGDPTATLIKDDLSYIVNVVNNGPSQSSDVTLTATLPVAGVTFQSASASRGKPCTQNNGNVTCDLQAMAADSQATVTIFIVPTLAGSTLHFSATVSVASDETDPNVNNNTVSALNTAVDNPSAADADLSILLSGNPPQLAANASLTYTMSVTNNGPDTAQGVVAALSLPASVTIPSIPAGCTKDPQTVVLRCSIGSIDAARSSSMQVTVTPTKGGIVNATASVSFLGQDVNTSNNIATVATSVTAAAGGGSSGGGGGGGGVMGWMALMGLAALYARKAAARQRGR